MALLPFELRRAFRDPFGLGLVDGILTPYWASVPESRLLDIGNQFGEVEDDNEKFAVHVDVSHFRPEELNTHVDGQTLTIEGCHRERTDKNGTIERSFKRSYLLPENCDLAGIQSSLESDGKLSIVAPKKGSLAQRREIPIEKKPAIKDKKDQ